jgi:hypothetical protein
MNEHKNWMSEDISPVAFYMAAKKLSEDIEIGNFPYGMCAAIDKVRPLWPDSKYDAHTYFLESVLGPSEKLENNPAFYGKLWGGTVEEMNAARIIGLLFAYEFAKDFLKTKG